MGLVLHLGTWDKLSIQDILTFKIILAKLICAQVLVNGFVLFEMGSMAPDIR
jgi:hypothetical protein